MGHLKNEQNWNLEFEHLEFPGMPHEKDKMGHFETTQNWNLEFEHLEFRENAPRK